MAWSAPPTDSVAKGNICAGPPVMLIGVPTAVGQVYEKAITGHSQPTAGPATRRTVMSNIPQPSHVNRKPIVAAILGGIVAVSSTQALMAGAAASNPPALKKPTLMLAAACNPCNPCAANKCNPCNPCAAKNACNPCNPCAAKNACNPCNPCAAKNACNPCNPCAAKKACNPCNPCGAAKVAAKDFLRPVGVGAPAASTQALVSRGKALWNDSSLGQSGLACQSCHVNSAALNATFAQSYPHQVAMPSQMAGVGAIHLDEMVQFCMVVPMQAKPLKWGSQDLAALTAYAAELQKGFNPCKVSKSACNPCNPCAAKKACNPCAAKKNPCNPCNPCAVKNPCKSS
jgi:hypothetical protein